MHRQRTQNNRDNYGDECKGRGQFNSNFPVAMMTTIKMMMEVPAMKRKAGTKPM